MTINHNFNEYGFVEGTDFEGLVPKAMEIMGDDYCAGLSEEVVSIYDPTANGTDSMKVISEQLIADSESGSTPDPEPEPTPDPEPEPEPTPDPEPEPEPTPDPEPEPEPEPEVVKPEVIENTEEQNAIEQNVLDGMAEGTKTFAPEGIINNITMPADATVSPTITGVFQNGATITNNTSKYIIVDNKSEEPIDISIEASESTANSPVYLRGKFNNIYLNGKALPVSSSIYPDVYGTVSVEDNGDTFTGVSLTLNFVGDECGVVYLGTAPLTISDGNTDDMGSPTIYAPNATVTMGGKYTEVTATVSENTLVLKSGFHSNKLSVLNGNVKFYGLDLADFVDEFIGEGTAEPYSWNIPEIGTISKMTSNPGIYNVTESVSGTSAIAFGIVANGKYRYNLNGNTVSSSNKNYVMFLRGTVNVSVYGDGKMMNTGEGYCAWVSSPNAMLNVYGGEFEGNTHTLYAENGTINVYDGVFKLTNADTAERDANGNLKFLLNCYDANYTAGTAKINVYGGKFYEFNPAATYGEPGGPVSYVAEGYHVVESTEDGKKVYTVVKD